MTYSPSTALSPKAAERLLKICGLLASDQPGEVVTAAAAATRIISRAGMTWETVLRPIVSQQPQPSSRPPGPPPFWRSAVTYCLTYPEYLSLWEREFLANLRRSASLSIKQSTVLNRLHSRILETTRGAE